MSIADWLGRAARDVSDFVAAVPSALEPAFQRVISVFKTRDDAASASTDEIARLKRELAARPTQEVRNLLGAAEEKGVRLAPEIERERDAYFEEWVAESEKREALEAENERLRQAAPRDEPTFGPPPTALRDEP